MATSKRSVLVFGLFCLALLILISGTEAMEQAINIGPCSDYPDCNAACIQALFKGGGCMFVKGTNSCFCQPKP